MEKLADVLPMDRAQPVKLDWFTRLDTALRRMPGLGLLMIFVLADYMYGQHYYFGLVLLTVGLARVVLMEFAAKK